MSKQENLISTPPNGACMMIRKKILKQIGGYREDLGAQDGFDVWSKIHPKYKFSLKKPLKF